MVTVIFWSRLRPEHKDEYEPVALRIAELAQKTPGFQSMKTFAADDGERVTIAEFDSMENAVAWRQDPEHLEAQRLGRERFYSEYRLQVCQPLRAYTFAEGKRSMQVGG
jgi:heme-degrading monooxygenase HmoA